MTLPNDPVMLLSFVNTQLRDFYSSFELFCEENDFDMEAIKNKLSMIDYEYNENNNRFE